MVYNIAEHLINFYYSYTWQCDIGIATFLGAIIGFERELRGKDAGIRTYAIIAMAACLFTILSRAVGGEHDPARIAAQIVSGMGFLGAGVIWHHKDGGTEGLTTAASMWGVGAIGMAIGFGYMSLALTSAFTVLIIMELFGVVVKGLQKTLKIKMEK